MKSNQSYNSHTIKCFQPNDSILGRSPIKYHYTSPGAIIPILKSRPDLGNDIGNLRFTDIRYMNDKSEKFYFIKALLSFLKKNIGKYPFCEEVVNELLLSDGYSSQDYIDYKVNDLTFNNKNHIHFQATRQFVFCMCEKKDSLNMWNYYVHNGNYQGYNLGLNINKIIKSFDTEDNSVIDPIFMYHGKVLYKEAEQTKEIKALLEHIEALKEENKNSDYSFEKGLLELQKYILSYGLFYKDESFSSENEYRIVIEISQNLIHNNKDNYFNKNNRRITFDYFERGGILVPCLNVPLEKEALSEITIAPIMEFQIAKNSLEEFLFINNYYNVEVNDSKIPIRF